MTKLDQWPQLALERLLPDLQAEIKRMTERDWKAFHGRLEKYWPRLFSDMYDLYGEQHDFYFTFQQILMSMINSWCRFDSTTKNRLSYTPEDWQQDTLLVGTNTYVDRLAGDFPELEAKVEYLQGKSINYLHLQPFFDVPEEDRNGGYAVGNNFRVHTTLKTQKEVSKALHSLQNKGFRIGLDFVLNHTSNQHMWAREALAGNPFYKDFYFFFTVHERAEYEGELRDIFPDKRSGCFTFNEKLDKWIWTTFNSFQWDLNYQNSAVFQAMAEQMMALVNMGADVINLVDLAFTWKEKGTCCENLPKVHNLISCFNSYTRIVAPGIILKAEAIIYPDEVK